jgi:hypothetical protein
VRPSSPYGASREEPCSVQQDWRAELPDPNRQLYDRIVSPVESAYGMMSVALDEAFARRDRAELVCAREQVSMSAELLERFARRLGAIVSEMGAYGRRLRAVPAVSPLRAEFFRGETAQSAATWSLLLHTLVPAGRWRFGNKLAALRKIVARLAAEFAEAAAEIAEGSCVDPRLRWSQLEEIHYDLNTCLCETLVVLKSFLRPLSGAELGALELRLEKIHAVPVETPQPDVAPLSTST